MRVAPPEVLCIYVPSIIFSNTFEMVGSKDIGRWFSGIEWFFPGLGIMTIVAFFHNILGK